MADIHFFGIVQYIGPGRTADWLEFYSQIFGFKPLPDRVRFGIMPKGLLLQSPCRNFYLQLIEPGDPAQDINPEEHLQRVGIGTPDVMSVPSVRENRATASLRMISPMPIGMCSLNRSHTWVPRSVRLSRRSP